VSNTLKGIAIMICGVALLTTNDAITKHLTQSHPVGQVICLRQAATLLVIVPYAMLVTGWRALRVVSWPWHLTRGLLFIGGSVLITELPRKHTDNDKNKMTNLGFGIVYSRSTARIQFMILVFYSVCFRVFPCDSMAEMPFRRHVIIRTLA